jgi:hypothetical protein
MLSRSHAVRASDTSSRYTPTRAIVSGRLFLPYYRAWRCLAPHGLRANIRMQARLHVAHMRRRLKKPFPRVSTRQSVISTCPSLRAPPPHIRRRESLPQLHAFATHLLPLPHQEHHGNSNKGYREYTIRAMWSHNGPNEASMSGTRSRAIAQKDIGRSFLFFDSSNSPRLRSRIQQDA